MKTSKGAGSTRKDTPAPVPSCKETTPLYPDMEAAVNTLTAHLCTVVEPADWPWCQDKPLWCKLAACLIYAVGESAMCERTIQQPPDLTRECLPFMIQCWATGKVVPEDQEAADRVFTIRAELGWLDSQEAGIRVVEGGAQ